MMWQNEQLYSSDSVIPISPSAGQTVRHQAEQRKNAYESPYYLVLTFKNLTWRQNFISYFPTTRITLRLIKNQVQSNKTDKLKFWPLS